MKNIYLLDTNIISHFTKPMPDEKLVSQLEFHGQNCCISSITWYELVNGVNLLESGIRKEKLETFLYDYVEPSFPIIAYDEHAAAINADITSVLIPQGKPTPILDTQIASIAIANNLILVTSNTKDFEIFAERFNLMLENWEQN